MLTLDSMKQYGANVEEGLTRCMKNEAFYLRLVSLVTKEENFNKLKSSIESEDLDAAFDAAHALKGVTGNLALTPLYDPIYEITELLRSRTDLAERVIMVEAARARELADIDTPADLEHLERML